MLVNYLLWLVDAGIFLPTVVRNYGFVDDYTRQFKCHNLLLKQMVAYSYAAMYTIPL